MWDGYANPEKLDDKGKLRAEFAICIDNGEAEVLNADLGNDSDNIDVGESQHVCQHEKLAPEDRNFGVCKSPTTVGQGSGNRLYDFYPGKPE